MAQCLRVVGLFTPTGTTLQFLKAMQERNFFSPGRHDRAIKIKHFVNLNI